MEGLNVPKQVALVTDFGSGSPYVGQIKLYIVGLNDKISVIELISDLPEFRFDLAAYLLPALVQNMPEGTVYLGVVDPGVGGKRSVLVLYADGNWFVGPDNGLFAILAKRSRFWKLWRINWRPEVYSASFHGRDIFAPIAVALVEGRLPVPATVIDSLESIVGWNWPIESSKIIYQDRYGNLITGLNARGCEHTWLLDIGKQKIPYARTFCEVAVGQCFWYENSFGLVEIAVNQSRADKNLNLAVGDEVCWSK